MLTTTNKLTKAFASGSLAIGATAAATLAGFGLASAPAQAGTLSVSGGQAKILTTTTPPGTSPFWSNFGPTVTGVDNGLVSFTGGHLKVDFYGKGFANPASFQNGFQLDLTGNPIDWSAAGSPFQSPSNGPNWVAATPILTKTVNLTSGNIPFQFLNDQTGINTKIVNGDPFNSAYHYFTYKSGESVYLGLDDSASTTSTTDSEDYLIKLTPVPEPSSVLGLLAIGGLGLAAVKRQKQS